MKKYLLLAFIAFSLLAQAQTKEGRVVYERTTQIQIRSFNNLPADVQSQIPRSRTDQYELLFTPEHSLWQFLPNATNEDPGTFSGGGVVLRMAGGANETTYIDFTKGTRVDQRELFEKSFLVTDSLTKNQWKLSDEMKTITLKDENKKDVTFTAHKATTTRILNRPRVTMENGQMKRENSTDTVPVVAWFTTDVPVPAGPDMQGQLPGLILELDVNKGQMLTKAIEFSSKVAASKIKEPKEGKRMTAAEFSKERDNLMEQMRQNMSQGNVIRMQ